MVYFINILFLLTFLLPAKLQDVEIVLVQPNGNIINCFASGDEYYNFVHDENGYTIVQSASDGYYYYATEENENIVPSLYRVGTVNPNLVILEKNLKISSADYYQKKSNYWDNIQLRDAPSIGIINNINIFIRFADEFEFSQSRQFYDNPFNLVEGPSMKDYFKEVSYDLLTVNTYHYPSTNTELNISYQDQYSRGYYQPYNEFTNPMGYQNDNESTFREHSLLKNAIEYIENEVPDDLDVDSNNDGYVDNVTFLIRGFPGAWSSLLWPHRWVLFSEDVYINGSRVYDYNLNLEQGGYFTVGTLCHEFFHSLGAPDLYHYWDDTAPIAVGGWDVMDQSSDIPQYMSAYMKYKYTDWINELPIIDNSGTYQIYPLSNPENNIFRINSSTSLDEYFVLEYRINQGIYDVNIPGDQDGLIIYRVNSTLNGNANGPPDELYVYRTNGTSISNGSFAGAVFNENIGKTDFNDNTNPSCFLYDGSPGAINIANIGTPGEFIQFDFINMILLPEINEITYDSDNDGVINPNEEIHLNLQISNLSNVDAENVVAFISSPDNNINILNNEILFQNINSNNSNMNTLVLLTNDTFGQNNLFINMNSIYEDDGNELNYNDSFTLSFNITLDQKGYPYSTINEIHSSPIVSDLNLDGENELIFGDHFGVIRSLDAYGNQIFNNVFPFETNGQIWGSPAIDDIDLDGFQDIIIVSKDHNVYAFDKNGLKWSFNTGSRLIGTPTIANINNSYEKEIIIAGYSDNSDNFIILDHLGYNIDNLIINDKNKSGFAVADFNNNSTDDVVFGTDENKIYLFYEGAELAPGFPFIGNDKFRKAPVVLKTPQSLRILAVTKENLYSINSDGTEHFSIELNDYISSSISILNNNNSILIFIGLNNGDILGINEEGQIEFQFNINTEIVGNIIFSDLDSNNTPEIIACNDQGELHVLNLNGSYYNFFPMYYDFPYSSSPLIVDIDNDNDLEIIGGTTNSLNIFDIKETNLNINNYWNMYGANKQRTNYYEFETICLNGDLDNSGLYDVSDIILMVNCILMHSCENCSDMNNDGLENIFDVVQLVNIVLDLE